MLFADVCVCTFQPGNFMSWGSYGVKIWLQGVGVRFSAFSHSHHLLLFFVCVFSPCKDNYLTGKFTAFPSVLWSGLMVSDFSDSMVCQFTSLV